MLKSEVTKRIVMIIVLGQFLPEKACFADDVDDLNVVTTSLCALSAANRIARERFDDSRTDIMEKNIKSLDKALDATANIITALRMCHEGAQEDHGEATIPILSEGQVIALASHRVVTCAETLKGVIKNSQKHLASLAKATEREISSFRGATDNRLLLESEAAISNVKKQLDKPSLMLQ